MLNRFMSLYIQFHTEGIMEKVAAPLGRLLLSLIFLLSGFGKIMDWSGTAGYMSSKGMPAVPFFLLMAILFEITGALLLLTGYKARLGAAALIVFLVPTTLIFHNFWAFSGAERQMQMVNFLKNLAIMGGLWVVVALGPGPLSLERRSPERKEPPTEEQPRSKAA